MKKLVNNRVNQGHLEKLRGTPKFNKHAAGRDLPAKLRKRFMPTLHWVGKNKVCCGLIFMDKIQSLANEYTAKEFRHWLTTQKITLRPAFSFAPRIASNDNAPALSKSLYVTEAGVNNLEARVIRGVADLENIVWWHRNLERGKGFVINGFLNHYPDFVVLTQNKNIIIVETKGDDRDNSDSKEKLKLGKIWEAQANRLSHETGYRYHYMMVFDTNRIDSAYATGEVLKVIEDL